MSRLPDFFIVGHPKCGTSAMCQMLRRDPQIYFNLKEPGFFVPELRAGAAGGKRPGTLAEYLALYADARPDQLAGDATPWYLASANAAADIAELQPEARVIAILREPASFLRSLHAQQVQDHVETEIDLRKALLLEDARREGRHIPPGCTRPHELLYSDYVRYVEQLQRFHAVFPSEQILVLIYDEFRSDNEGTMRRVLRFLGADDTVPIEVFDANPTVRVRSPRLYQLVRSVSFGRGPLARAAGSTIKALSSRRLRHRALAAQRRMQWGRPEPPDPELMLELRRRFKDEVLAVSEYLDRDLLALWGYEDVG
jgi:hypothetical protein